MSSQIQADALHATTGIDRQAAARGIRIALGVITVILAAIVAVLVALLAAFTVLVLPRFEVIFDDFDRELPLVTSLLLSRPVWACVLTGALGMTVSALLLQFLAGRRAIGTTLALLVVLWLVGWALVTVAALFLPLVALMNSVM